MSGSKGPHRRGGYNKYRSDHSKLSAKDKTKDLEEHLNENNPVYQMFKNYAVELDSKHDRYERIVKLSRDITIESKRIIFLLHSAATDLDDKKEQIYKETDLRLNQLTEKNFKQVAQELHGQDHYLYIRAYTAGLQEFIEALLYYQFLRYGNIEHWRNLDTKLSYLVPNDMTENTTETEVPKTELNVTIPPIDFFLGLGDFTGELMRRCINSLGSGNIEDCFRICNYVKDIYTGFLGINTSGYKEIGRKVYVLKQSLQKMEYACYTIQVRGSEIPRHMLATVINTVANSEINNEEDEGFY
ncbi:hypothetical protein PPYR_02135 [Photinus pyralis]|uniref:Translin-associated protein X n=1 Tax=Photinus pyralis TaxID=7054 RepID=A0A1Y1LKQ6_PHOPY|nr:translin-associated protein X [Photinus pyralis]KAB0805165.1 hypothetical protein PPYR_02135 [Photinus pyralis]